MKTPEQCVNYVILVCLPLIEEISHIVQVFLFSTLNKYIVAGLLFLQVLQSWTYTTSCK